MSSVQKIDNQLMKPGKFGKILYIPKIKKKSLIKIIPRDMIHISNFTYVDVSKWALVIYENLKPLCMKFFLVE